MTFMNNELRTANTGRRPRRRWLASLTRGILGAGIVAGMSIYAQPASTDSAPSFDSFKIIIRNNIFDPNRSPRIAYTNHSQRVERRATDYIALVGTMSYEKGKFAFFDGSNGQYKKVLEPGGSLAGYTVKEITQNDVTLAANGKEFQMKVGTQLRNDGQSGWKLSTNTDLPSEVASNGESTAAESSAPPAGVTPQMSDVLKKLMEQRQQELK